MKPFEINAPTSDAPTLRYNNQILTRLHDTTPYLIAGALFTFGSFQYLAYVSDYELGGWLFTLGSVCFLYGDMNEWLKLPRVECFHTALYIAHYSKTRDDLGEVVETSWYCQLQLSGNYWNSLLSVVGSILYLVGSIMFIPQLNVFVIGTIMYIVASFVIFLSQMAKLYRSGCCEPPPSATLPLADETATHMKPNYSSENTFQLRHLVRDIPAVGVDLSAGLGGFAYLIGSYLFLPSVAVTEADITHAAIWFIAGGVLFFISGILLVYRSCSCIGGDGAEVSTIANTSTCTAVVSEMEKL